MESGCRLYCSHGNSNARGAMIMIKSNAGIDVLEKQTDNEGRFVILKCQIQNKIYLLINIYAPNEDSPRFFFTNDTIGILLNV